jgi:hypothetical protein
MQRPVQEPAPQRRRHGHVRQRVGVAVAEGSEPAAGLLGLVHRPVGVAVQGLRVARVIGVDGGSDAGADAKLGIGNRERRLHPLGDPATDGRRRGCGIDVGFELGEHHELVAAMARDDVAGAAHAFQAPGHLAQELVAGSVAQPVVDELEAVEVDRQQRDSAPVLSGAERSVEVFGEPRAVGQPGERIVVGEMREARRGARSVVRLPGLGRGRHTPVNRP